MNTTEYDKVALITGSSHGIGLELTRRLLSEGFQVIALNRSAFPEDDPLLQESLERRRLRVHRADLSDFESLRRALDAIKASEEKIDVLFNNAGGSVPELTFSKQGRELHFELQTVVPYVIAMELRELLRRGALKTVVNTSTNAFDMTRRFDPDALERPASFKQLFGPYAASKLALSLWTREVAPLLERDGIRIRSVDPGPNNTLRKGKRSGLPFYLAPLMRFFSHPSQGASRLYEAAFGASRELSGVYLRKDRTRDLPFREHGPRVLEKVRSIHEREFAARRSPERSPQNSRQSPGASSAPKL
ncbi:SDR family NAD(P)-dependent oxidoreductase [Sorangium sp. So ce1024]|uniref:SDR family NAD(P)-dependent oxidoreductase n=1 Tax=unclassified Sorangium TaxID=2621164 RepID=UPI003F02433E